MRWGKTGWVDIIGNDVTKYTIPAGVSASGDIDCNNGIDIYLKVSVKVVIVFGSSPNDYTKINIYGVDADSADEQDTIPIWDQKINEQASQERRVTVANLDVSAIDTLRVEIKNNNSADDINVWVSYFAAIDLH